MVCEVVCEALCGLDHDALAQGGLGEGNRLNFPSFGDLLKDQCPSYCDIGP